MATFILGGIAEQVASTATAAATTTLTNSSKQIQIFTGSTTQTVVLPDATTMVAGQKFEIYNTSSGAVTVKYNDNTTFATVAANTTLLIKLSSAATSNGTWVQFSSGSSGSFAGTSTHVAVTGNTSFSSANAGNTLELNVSAAATITMPAASAFSDSYIYIKDIAGNLNTNNVTLDRTAGGSIEGLAANYALATNFGSWILYSDGTNWYFTG